MWKLEMLSLLKKALEVFFGLRQLLLTCLSHPSPQFLQISPSISQRNDSFPPGNWGLYVLVLACMLHFVIMLLLTLCASEGVQNVPPRVCRHAHKMVMALSEYCFD